MAQRSALPQLLDVAEADDLTFRTTSQRVLGEVVGCDEVHLIPFDACFASDAPEYVRTFAARPDYAAPVFRALRSANTLGAYVDTELLPDRVRDSLPYYQEVMKPNGIRSQLVHLVRFRGRTIGVLHCNRLGERARPFSADAIPMVRELVQVVAVSMAARAIVPHPPLADIGLGPREMQVAELAAYGFGNLQIAAQLDRSVNTVRNQLQVVFKKLGVFSRVDLANAVFGRAEPGALDALALSARAAVARLDREGLRLR